MVTIERALTSSQRAFLSLPHEATAVAVGGTFCVAAPRLQLLQPATTRLSGAVLVDAK